MFKIYYIVDTNEEEYKYPKQGFCKVPALPQKDNTFIIKDFEFKVTTVYFEYVKDDDAYMAHLILK